jgi:hypothetical protein
MNAKDLPPLPEQLAEEMRALRRVEPPDELVERAFGRLPERNTSSPRCESRPAPRSAALRAAFVNAAPVLALAALFLFVVFRNENAREVVRSEERAVALPEEGHAWTDLDLQTQHHAEHPAVVHVEVPTHVRVRLPAGDGQPLEQHCTEARCVHKFTHSLNGTPLRVAVAHPGRYEIHVRHESKKASLRERFVLTAKRD